MRVKQVLITFDQVSEAKNKCELFQVLAITMTLVKNLFKLYF